MTFANAPSPPRWRNAPLADVIDLTLSSVDKKSKVGELNVLLCNYMDVYSNEHIRSGMDFMSATATAREIEKCSLYPGDVVITKDSEAYDDIGVPALVRDDVPDLVCGYHLAILRARPEIDGAYLFYALRSRAVQQQFHAYANGVTRFGLRKADIGLVEIPLPPLEEQRAIARVLGALDDKIELNRRMSETLEEMARALFRSWFVDFDPVRAKAEGRPSGLPPDLDALFPASFEASELGEIPAEWEVMALGDVADTVRGRSYRSAELAESDTALVTLKSFARGGGYRPEGLKSYTGRYKPEQVVRPGELVVACTDVTQAAEVVGRPAIVQGDERFETFVASLDTLIVRPRASCAVSVPFLYCLGKTPSFTHHTYSRVSGTTVLHLAKDAVPSYTFPVAPQGILDAFNSFVEPAFGRLTDFASDSERIRNVRDALLPRLVSGEVRVGGARVPED